MISLHANMLSLLYGSALQFRPSFFNSATRVVSTAGRAHYSSTTDPEWKPTHQYATKSNEIRARRFATDPEYREALRVHHRGWIAQNRDKIRASVAKQVASRDFEKLYHAPRRARWASDNHYKQRASLRRWLEQRPWARDLTWRTHRPILSEKTVRYCGGCRITRPLKLWWQDQKTDEFLCHPCFTSDWSRALPIGHEDKVFGFMKSKSTTTTTGNKPGPDA